MKNTDKRIIRDEKVDYLVRTLSRTKRKDYENYVVNAIWNRLNKDSIEIVTQQYIYNPKKPKKDKNGKKRNHYFIDLYFPALNIGIECNEAFHKKQKDDDQKREADIKERLEKQLQEAIMDGFLNKRQINYKEYKSIPIDVTKTYKEVDNDINNAVSFINQKIKECKPEKWEILEATEYYKDRKEITINDKVGFKSIVEVCNVLFNTGYEQSSGRRRTCFIPDIFKKSNKKYKVWFPKLAIRDENDELIAATNTGWENQLKNGGEIIIQENKKDQKKQTSKKHDKIPRIVFAHYKDTLGDLSYKFIGIFEPDPKHKGRKQYYKRISKKCKIKQYFYKITEAQ